MVTLSAISVKQKYSCEILSYAIMQKNKLVNKEYLHYNEKISEINIQQIKNRRKDFERRSSNCIGLRWTV